MINIIERFIDWYMSLLEFENNKPLKNFSNIQVKYMGGASSNFYNAQNYVFGKYSKELCENIVYVKNLYNTNKSFGIFFKNELIDEKRTDIFLKIITIITIFFIAYFLYSHGILKNMKNIIFFLGFSIPLSLLPFYLTRIDPEKVIEYKLYNYFVAKGLNTRKWIIIYKQKQYKRPIGTKHALRNHSENDFLNNISSLGNID